MSKSNLFDFDNIESDFKEKESQDGLKSASTNMLVDFLANSEKLVEGLFALKGAKTLSLKYRLDTPIINAIDDFINNGLKIDDIILNLLKRPIKMEF